MNEQFPQAAIDFLNAFYNAKNISIHNNKQIKKKALRESFGLENTVFTVDEPNELKTIEFYVLTKLGII